MTTSSSELTKKVTKLMVPNIVLVILMIFEILCLLYDNSADNTAGVQFLSKTPKMDNQPTVPEFKQPNSRGNGLLWIFLNNLQPCMRNTHLGCGGKTHSSCGEPSVRQRWGSICFCVHI